MNPGDQLYVGFVLAECVLRKRAAMQGPEEEDERRKRQPNVPGAIIGSLLGGAAGAGLGYLGYSKLPPSMRANLNQSLGSGAARLTHALTLDLANQRNEETPRPAFGEDPLGWARDSARDQLRPYAYGEGGLMLGDEVGAQVPRLAGAGLGGLAGIALGGYLGGKL